MTIRWDPDRFMLTFEVESDEPDGAPRFHWIGWSISDEWCALFRLATRDGEFEVVEVRVLPGRAERYRERTEATRGDPGLPIEPIPPGGLPSNLMRKVYPDKARREAVEVWRRTLRKQLGDDATAAHMARLGISWELTMTENLNKHPGRRGRPDRFYANVAAIQAGFIKKESRRHNVDTAALLTEQLGEDVTPEKVRDWMHTARIKGIARRQRSGGLTPRGERLLAEEVGDDGMGN
jgi:hypothetical protein